MSKFEELCKSYAISRKNSFTYKNECFQFANKLIDQMIDYFEIPRELLRYVPADKKAEPETVYTIRGAMHLDDDTYWHFRIVMTIYEEPNVCPRQPILLVFQIKKDDERFTVKISEEDSGHRIDIDAESDFKEFCEFLFRTIKDHFEKGLQCFLEKTAMVQQIGYRQSN